MHREPITIPSESLTFPLRNAARRFPEKVAVIAPEAGGKETTYRSLEDQSSLLAAALADAGIRPGDRVALWMRNSLEYILSFYGILKAGAVVVPVSTHYGSREVLHQLNATQAACLIAQEDLIGPLGDRVAGAYVNTAHDFGQGRENRRREPFRSRPCSRERSGSIARSESIPNEPSPCSPSPAARRACPKGSC